MTRKDYEQLELWWGVACSEVDARDDLPTRRRKAIARTAELAGRTEAEVTTFLAEMAEREGSVERV
jgi:hypothetical protein